jgi:hypothetical protein
MGVHPGFCFQFLVSVEYQITVIEGGTVDCVSVKRLTGTERVIRESLSSHHRCRRCVCRFSSCVVLLHERMNLLRNDANLKCSLSPCEVFLVLFV